MNGYDFYNEKRPHQGIGNCVPMVIDHQPATKPNRPVGRVHCDQYLGALLKSYRRAA